MNDVSSHWYHFGPFQLCPSERKLLREGQPVDLTPRTFDTLAYLVQNAPAIVTSEALMTAVWKGTVVEAANIAQQVYYVRKALNDIPRNRKYEYIENVAGSGYRFIAKVEERLEPVRNGGQSGTATAAAPALIAPQILETTPSLTETSRTAGARLRWWIVVLPTVAAAGLLIMAARALAPLDPRVLKYTQLTGDGKQKTGPLLTDGHQIFYREYEGNGRIMTVPVSGGDPEPVANISPGAAETDISANGDLLLFIRPSTDGSQLWVHSLGNGTSQLIRASLEGSWAPDGKTLALADEGALDIDRPGKTPERIAVRGRSDNPQWSPDGRRIRFAVSEPDTTSLWEVSFDGSGLHQIPGLSNVAQITQNGVWTPDGKYFFFEAGGPRLADNIWVSRDNGALRGFFKSKAVPLTDGPGSWKWPLPDKFAPGRVFAIHQIPKPELVSLDPASQKWRPYWDGYPAYEVDFSRDGQWAAFVRNPENTLWKARPDGTEKLQLTTRGFEVHHPNWSPDGKQIAFMGRKQGEPSRVFIVSSDGRDVRAPMPSSSDQGAPTWSPDGKLVIFGDTRYAKPAIYMNIHSLNIATGKLTDVPNSRGMLNARWSPDGKRILAVSVDSSTLYSLSLPGTEWKQLLREHFIDHATWSADSRYIYFNGKIDIEHPMDLFRLAIAPGSTPEKLADLKDFRWAPDNWFGITPSGLPLALHDASAEEIFALDYVLR